MELDVSVDEYKWTDCIGSVLGWRLYRSRVWNDKNEKKECTDHSETSFCEPVPTRGIFSATIIFRHPIRFLFFRHPISFFRPATHLSVFPSTCFNWSSDQSSHRDQILEHRQKVALEQRQHALEQRHTGSTIPSSSTNIALEHRQCALEQRHHILEQTHL